MKEEDKRETPLPEWQGVKFTAKIQQAVEKSFCVFDNYGFLSNSFRKPFCLPFRYSHYFILYFPFR